MVILRYDMLQYINIAYIYKQFDKQSFEAYCMSWVEGDSEVILI